MNNKILTVCFDIQRHCKWLIYNHELLVDPFNFDIFKEKTLLSLNKEYEDSVSYFNTQNLNKLIDLLKVF